MSQSYLLDHYIEGYLSKKQKEEERKKQVQADPTKSILIRRLQARLAREQDSRVVITGEGGIGKSTLELRLAELLTPQLYVENIEVAVEKAISFAASQYMDGIRTFPTGTQLSYDEPAQSWHHREFMSEASIILSKTMIGYRYKKFYNVLTVPNIDLIDVDAIRLINYMIYVAKQGEAQVFRVMSPKFGGHPWYKTVINKLRFSKPSMKLWHPYEKRKFNTQDKLYEIYGKQLKEMETPKLTNAEIVERILESPEKYMKGKLLHHALIQQAFDVGLNRSYLIKAIADGKSQEKKQESADSV